MRAPFQILAIPYRIVDGNPLSCIFRRSDFDRRQFISGGEDDETPRQAAMREIFEESGVHAENMVQLQSVCSIPTDSFPEKYLYNRAPDACVVPEYAFGFACAGGIELSREHTACVWLPYDEARSKCQWDSNRTALYELHCRLKAADDQE